MKKVVPQSECIERVSVKRVFYSSKQGRTGPEIGIGEKKSADKGEDHCDPVLKYNVHIGKKQGVYKDEEEAVPFEETLIAVIEVVSKEELLYKSRKKWIQQHDKKPKQRSCLCQCQEVFRLVEQDKQSHDDADKKIPFQHGIERFTFKVKGKGLDLIAAQVQIGVERHRPEYQHDRLFGKKAGYDKQRRTDKHQKDLDQKRCFIHLITIAQLYYDSSEEWKKGVFL